MSASILVLECYAGPWTATLCHNADRDQYDVWLQHHLDTIGRSDAQAEVAMQLLFGDLDDSSVPCPMRANDALIKLRDRYHQLTRS